jgi:ribosomal protein S12
LAQKSSRVVTHSQITGLVGKAYLKMATATIAANKFQKTGFFPFNHHILDEHDPARILTQHHNLFA